MVAGPRSQANRDSDRRVREILEKTPTKRTASRSTSSNRPAPAGQLPDLPPKAGGLGKRSAPSANDSALVDASVGSLFATSFKTPSESTHGTGAVPASTSDAADGAAPYTVDISADALPMDWSLVTHVSLAFPEPLESLQSFHCVSSSCRGRAVSQAALRAATPQDEDPPAALLAAALHWQSPSPPLPPSRAAAMTALFTARWDQFREALEGAFLSLCHGTLPAFYVLTPQGSTRSLAALFSASGQRGQARMTATLTRTSAAMRKSLAEAPYGVRYQAPGLPEGVAGHRLGGAGELDSDSQLLCRGRVAVHGLMEYLSNELPGLCGPGVDAPLLLSPLPCLHAALCQLPVRVGPSRMLHLGGAEEQAVQRLEMGWPPASCTAAGGGSRSGAGGEPGGRIPPWCTARLLRLAVTSGHTFNWQQEGVPLTNSVNAGLLRAEAQSGGTERCTTAAGVPHAIAGVSGEAWRSLSSHLEGRTVQSVKRTAGVEAATVTVSKRVTRLHASRRNGAIT